MQCCILSSVLPLLNWKIIVRAEVADSEKLSVGCWSPIVLITYDEESLNVSFSALSLSTQAGNLYNAVCF